jgi:hypothetical protein
MSWKLGPKNVRINEIDCLSMRRRKFGQKKKNMSINVVVGLVFKRKRDMASQVGHFWFLHVYNALTVLSC